MLYLPVNNFSVMSRWFPVSLGWISRISCSRTQCRVSSESRTSNPSISSLTLHHRATSLLTDCLTELLVCLCWYFTSPSTIFQSCQNVFASFWDEQVIVPLLKGTTRSLWWVSNLSQSNTLPLSHWAPLTAPEHIFRNHSSIYQPCFATKANNLVRQSGPQTENYFCYFSTETYVVGTQKNCLDEMILLSTQNTCLNW